MVQQIQNNSYIEHMFTGSVRTQKSIYRMSMKICAGPVRQITAHQQQQLLQWLILFYQRVCMNNLI